jgi:mycothiol synthase
MNIRPFQSTNKDYAALLAIHKLLQPEDQLTVEMLRNQDDEFSANHAFVRILGEADNQIVAHGAYWHSSVAADEPHQFSLFVHPDYQNGRLPGLMQTYLLSKIAEQQPAVIASEAKEDEKYRTHLLEAANFKLKMRFPRSQLNVALFDGIVYDNLIAQLGQQGIAFITLTDVMQRDSNWQRHIWRLFTIIDQDVPYPDSQESVPFETYAKYYEGELFRPDSWAIAVDATQAGAQQYVGMSVVNIMPTRPDTLFAGITGVAPSHRRRKIATMLKVCSARYAQQHGYRYIYTDNEENNPMYRLNLQLGFEPLPAWVYYEKQDF